MNKVLILHASANIGGAEYSLLELLRNLKDYPIEIYIVHNSQTKQLFQNVMNTPVFFYNFELNYLKKHQNFKSLLHSLTSLIICNYKIFRLVKKHNIKNIYCNTFRSLPYCLTTKLLTKTQIICHCRDNVTSTFIRYLIKYGSDKTIAVSAFIKNQILSDDKVKIIHNGVNISYFSDSKPTGWLHKELNLSPNISFIGNIGQIVSWKNQTDYILIAKELIKINTNLHFLLIGRSVDDNYYSLLKQQICSFNLNSYFTLIGQVEDIKKYIGEIDILVHTATNEPFGRIVIEAAAASTPVLAYDSGGISEIIKDGETGFLIQYRNIHRMVDCIFLLLNDQSLRQSIGRNAQKYMVESFNSIDYTSRVYNILVND